MENLLREKETIGHEITKIKQQYEEYKNSEIQIEENLENLKTQYLAAIEKYESIKTTLKQKKKRFEILKTKIKNYKQDKYQEIKQIYEKQFTLHLSDINNVQISFNIQIFDSFKQYMEILRDIKFKNLKKHFEIYINNIKSQLKDKLIEDLTHQNLIHKIILKLQFVIKYEKYFEENIIQECLNEYIKVRYEYHFSSNKDTNRLDKADWIFSWLQNKIDEIYKIIKVYCNLTKCEKFDETSFLLLEDIVKNVNFLIEQKIDEIHNIQSNQKREILINFNFYLMGYLKYLNANYKIELQNYFLEFENELIHEEKNILIEKLKIVHQKNFKEWFNNYEEIFKECIDLNKKKLRINANTILKYIIDYNMVFIDSMRYINRSEIKVLIFLFNKFENLKEFCIFENVKIKNSKEKNSEDIFDDIFIFEITKFNLANFKLIKSLFENDIRNILNIKYYFINDVSIILDEYKSCLGFFKLKNSASEMIDNYFLNDILLKNILDKEEFFDLLNIFKELKNYFEIKKWKSRDCMKCIKGFFEGKQFKNEYFEHIWKMYNVSY